MSQYDVTEVPQIVARGDAEKLHKIGAHNTEDILRQGATPQARKQLAQRAHLPLPTIEKLARRADLLRLPDVGPEHVLLFEAAGVKSVQDLGAREPSALAASLAAVNREKKIVGLMPSKEQIARWVRQARGLPVMLR